MTESEPREPRDSQPAPAVPAWVSSLRSDEGLFVADEHQRIVAWSPSAEKALGYPMGPFRLMDLTGIDVNYLVRLDKYKATGDPADKPSRILEEKYKAGHLGRKTGRGFYEY